MKLPFSKLLEVICAFKINYMLHQHIAYIKYILLKSSFNKLRKMYNYKIICVHCVDCPEP